MAGLTGCLRPAEGGSRSRGDTWHPRSCPAPRGGCWSPGDTWRPRSCPEPEGGSRSRGDTWRPRSCTAPGGGYWSPGDMWRPRSCREPRGGYHSTAPSSAPFRGRSGRGGACHAPENPHQMITRDKSGFRVVPDRLVLTVAISSPTPSPIPSSACAALVDPHWCAAMEEEYGALISNGSWFPDLRAPTLSPASGSSRTSSVLTGPWIATRPVGSFGVSLSAPESTTMRLSARL
jgi:hypothetical protein